MLSDRFTTYEIEKLRNAEYSYNVNDGKEYFYHRNKGSHDVKISKEYGEYVVDIYDEQFQKTTIKRYKKFGNLLRSFIGEK